MKNKQFYKISIKMLIFCDTYNIISWAGIRMAWLSGYKKRRRAEARLPFPPSHNKGVFDERDSSSLCNGPEAVLAFCEIRYGIRFPSQFH